MPENPAKFFDEILTILSSNFNRSFLVDEIAVIIFDLPLGKIKNGILIFDVPPTDEQITNLLNALLFLNKNALLVLTNNNREAYITTEGFIKIKTKGFHKEIKEKKFNNRLQRFAWIATPVAAIITLMITIYNFVNCNI